MKIVAAGSVRAMSSSTRGGCVRVVVVFPIDEGRVLLDHVTEVTRGDGTFESDARAATVDLRIEMRSAVAEKLRYGQPIYVTIDTDDPSKSST